MRQPSDTLKALLLAIGTIVTLLAVCAPFAHAGGVPRAAQQYQRDLVRTAQNVWGLGAPVAILAAQVHQESGWKTDAKSAYASGLAQFTPATAKDMARLYPAELRDAAPTNPAWALLALCRYDLQLYTAVSYAATDLDRWAFVLSGYNGGPGWVTRDRAKARAQGLNPAFWWDNVEVVNAGRAPQFWNENRGYPRRILLLLLPVYVKAGWGKGVK
ncbi:MAG: hypothetical protein CVU73_11175 [Deltaproteobacteria bacterium HGW-Deltaproteobacteria-8]|jgi:membrane-bound lytic murein transglycosylase MltF|nr:MAG: hypothetical protein CVU73_11175 [Deltaproteobacteria bacterium HGW-Deltaproteobacteria-8]